MPRTLFVTGGSAGIGAACARMAAARGRDVVLTFRSDMAGAEAVARDVEAAGRQARILRCDVAEPGQIDAAFAELGDTPIDLVNNAGIAGTKASLADLDPERVAQMFSVNAVGALLVARAAVTHMRSCGTPGHIVNVSSVAARLGSAHQYIDYAATKGAVDTMTLGLADELASEGIRVNAVRPGLIATEIHAKGGEPDRLDRLGPGVPLGRPGSADEVAETILWLLSDAASYVTRTLVDVGGGR